MEDTKQRKAKRKLSDIDFSSEGAHVALVSQDQGNGANGHHYALVMKAVNFSEETIEKASQVKVTLEITEFLTRMFGMYSDDAEVLARALGFTTKEVDGSTEYETYQDYITSKVQSIEVMKSLYESDSISKVMSDLSEDEYLALLQDQEIIEKAFSKIEKQNKKNSGSVKKAKLKLAPTEEDTPAKGDVVKTTTTGEGESSSVVKHNKKDKNMTKEVDVQIVEQETEMVNKAQFDEIRKAFEDQKEALEKALASVKQFEEEKKELIAKARKEALAGVCGDHADVIFKACSEADDDAFAAVVQALGAIKQAVDSSDLFVEKGVTAPEEVQENESGVMKLIKAKHFSK